MLNKIKNAFKSMSSKHGSYSVGLIAIVIAIAVAVNLVIAQLPEKVRSVDISDNKLYAITNTTKKIINKLNSDITITVYAEKDTTDTRIKTFLNKYQDLSSRLKVKWVDPVLHPAELSANNVEKDSIVVSSAKTKKNTTVAFSDILVADESAYYSTGSTEASEFDGEGQLTSVVNYVTQTSEKKLYYTTGHGETTFSTSVNDLLDKNNISQDELNLMMKNKIPDDCDLLLINGATADISRDEQNLLTAYIKKGGKVFIILGDTQEQLPNLKALLKEYGMSTVDGYIADAQRNYQGNYYYIFPNLTATGDLAKGLSSDMVLLANARGLTLTDPARDTISVSDFMTTSDSGYAITEDKQTQGTYVLGAVATETAAADKKDSTAAGDASSNTAGDSTTASDSATDADTAAGGRLTVVSSGSLIDSQLTDNLSTLENLDLFMNAVTANFDDVNNVAIASKSLGTTYNTMKHAGTIGIFSILGIPVIVLVYGFVNWLKRRKA